MREKSTKYLWKEMPGKEDSYTSLNWNVLLPKYREESYVAERDYREEQQVTVCEACQRLDHMAPLGQDEIGGFCATCDGKSRGIT